MGGWVFFRIFSHIGGRWVYSLLFSLKIGGLDISPQKLPYLGVAVEKNPNFGGSWELKLFSFFGGGG